MHETPAHRGRRVRVLTLVGICFFALVVASGRSYVGTDYSQKSVAELIDDLTQIDSESIAINTVYLRAGFIAYETPDSLRATRYGVLPDAPPQMRELVRRGPLALPELIEHLDDKRLTKLDVGGPRPGNPSVFYGKAFGDAYSPRIRESQQSVRDSQRSGLNPSSTPKSFTTYTLRVGDICYALIGQIVSRQLRAVQPIPSGFLTVNSPLMAPVLIEKIRTDWGKGEAETLKASLMADIHGTSGPFQNIHTEKEDLYTEIVVNPALRRLRLYFPDTYNALAGDDLARKLEFERQDAAPKPVSTR
jgi:hypothetical protein